MLPAAISLSGGEPTLKYQIADDAGNLRVLADGRPLFQYNYGFVSRHCGCLLLRHESFTVEPGKTLEMKYRCIVPDGSLTPEESKRLWQT